ncbi:MAG: hypothetical protein GY928_21430 [Colwellia sp.]|nr:hypothetical protein [Colwellia sp.]
MKNYEEKMQALLWTQKDKCKSCGKFFKAGQKVDLAHKIKASKYNYKEYGEEIIDHILNLAATHTGNCNDAQNMSRAAHPVEAMQLIEEIKQEIKEMK